MITKTPEGRTLINGVELQYVSGSCLPFFKLKHKNKDIQKENFDDFVKIFAYMQSHLKGYFTMGTLYNAYQEKADGIFLTENDKLGHKVILSDSGGLQQARRGEKFSDKVINRLTLYHCILTDYILRNIEFISSPQIAGLLKKNTDFVFWY